MKKLGLSSLLLILLFMVTQSWALTVSVRVSSSNDDGEEQNPPNNSVYRNSSDLELAYDGGTRQHIGLRFQSLVIPQGATINNAYIEFEVDETDSGTTDLVIYGQDTDDAGTFGNGANNISNRTRTSASVNWSIPAWNVVSAKQQTPDITTIIQEIVDRTGWSSGNDLAVIIEPGAGCNSSSCQRTAESEDGEAANAPLLVIDYTVGGAGLTCETFLDEFTTESYSRQDGTVNWTTNWIEIGDNGAVSSGDIEVSGGQLQLEGDGSGGGHAAFSGDPSVEREADLSAYSSATLTFDYSESGNWEGNDDIDIYVSNDGGGSWNLIQTFTNDQSPGSFSQDISTYIAANTRIAFVERANSSSEIFFFDNVQIEACSSGGPTVDSLTTSDITPVITGTFDSGGSAGGFTVIVNSVTYTLGSSPELTNSGDDWSLDLSSATPLAIGAYDVAATSDDGAGNTLSDTTTNELNIIALVCSAIFRDEFSSVSYANNDGDTNFSGNWDEFEGSSLTVPEASPDPASGHVTISGGQLVLNNYSPESGNAPGVERQLDLSMFTSATFSFDFVTSGNVDNDDSLLVQASSNGGVSWTLLEDISGVGDTSGSRSYDLTPYISATTRIRLRFNTTINSGSCCYGASPETISFDNINIASTGTCPSVDHYTITHSGTGITCAAETITVTAHNADHTAYTVTSDTAIIVTTNPVVDAITTSPVTITTGNSSATFSITETSVTSSIDINVTDGTSTETSGSAETNPVSVDYDDPKLEFVDSLFQFVTDTNVPPVATIGTHIGGKPSSTAPNSHDLYLRAVRTDDATGAAVCVSALDPGTHAINMGYQCIDTNDCSANELSVTNNLTYNSGAATAIAHNDGATTANVLPVSLDFDVTGYAPLSFLYSNVGQIALYADDYMINGGTINGDASNTFVVRPFGLTLDFGDSGDGDGDIYDMREDDWNIGGLDGSNNNSSYAANSSGTSFKRAGENFPAEVTAVLWQSSDDADNNGVADASANLYNNVVANLYGQEATSVLLSTNGSTSFQASRILQDPAAGDAGTFTGIATAGGLSTSFTNGKAIATLNWDEVGIIAIQMVVTDYLGDNSYSSSYVSEEIGRFYPDHFVLSDMQLTNRSDLACASAFTYMGENFEVSYDLEARNVGGQPTQNYTTASGFAKLNLASELNYGAADLAGPTDLTARLNTGSPAISFVAGLADDITGTLDLVRLVAGPDGPYALSVGIAPTDDDGVLLNSYDLDISGGGNDHGLIQSTVIEYGRLVIANAHGSELVPLTIPMKMQYYDAATNSFLGNAIDNCTVFDAPANINLAEPPSIYTLPLATANLALTGAGLFTGGLASFSLHDNASTTVGPGVTGDVSYAMTVPGYLQYDWDGDNVFTDDPTAKATFGIYSGNSKQIYYRQLYQ